MKTAPKVAAVLLGIVLCMSLFSSIAQPAFSSPPPPKIVFKGIKDGCKIFEITDIDQGVGGFIKKVVVEGTNITPTVTPALAAAQVDNVFTFDYAGAGKGSQNIVTLKVCGKPLESISQFTIKAFDDDDVMSNQVIAVNHKAFLNSGLEVNGEIAFLVNLALGKQELCIAAQKKGVPAISTELVELQLTGLPGGQPLTVEKTPNVKKPVIRDCDLLPNAAALIAGLLAVPGPGILILAGDPEGDVFLSVLELCIDNFDNCPQNFPTSILLAPIPIGGELIPIDTTSLVIAGVQTNLAWIIPLVFSAAGIGFILVRKKF